MSPFTIEKLVLSPAQLRAVRRRAGLPRPLFGLATAIGVATFVVALVIGLSERVGAQLATGGLIAFLTGCGGFALDLLPFPRSREAQRAVGEIGTQWVDDAELGRVMAVTTERRLFLPFKRPEIREIAAIDYYPDTGLVLAVFAVDGGMLWTIDGYLPRDQRLSSRDPQTIAVTL